MQGEFRHDVLEVSLDASNNSNQFPGPNRVIKVELPGDSLFLSSLPDNTFGGIRHRRGGDIQTVPSNQRPCIHETRDVCENEKSDGGEGTHVY